MNGVAIIEMGKTGERGRLVNGYQFAYVKTEMSIRHPSGDVKSTCGYINLMFRE